MQTELEESIRHPDPDIAAHSMLLQDEKNNYAQLWKIHILVSS